MKTRTKTATKRKLNFPGIYRITCIPTGDRYIGQAENIGVRWRQHRNHLNNRKHCNDGLQKLWSRYGEDSFRFEVVERCYRWQLDGREKAWIHKEGTLNGVRPKPSAFEVFRVQWGALVVFAALLVFGVLWLRK